MTAHTGTATHYKIIHDERQITQFADAVLKHCSAENTCFLTLFARTKYDKEFAATLPSGVSDIVDQRYLADGSDLVRSVRKLEVPLGCYVAKVDGRLVEMPNSTLALYVNPNSHSMAKAWMQVNTDFSKALLDHFEGKTPQRENILVRPDKELKSKITTCLSESGTFFYDLDIDTKSKDLLRAVHAILTQENAMRHVACIVETHGGFHVLMNKSRDYNSCMKRLHELSVETKSEKLNRNGVKVADKMITILNNSHIPLPGTLQGGFPVRIVTFDDILGTPDSPVAL